MLSQATVPASKIRLALLHDKATKSREVVECDRWMRTWRRISLSLGQAIFSALSGLQPLKSGDASFDRLIA